MQKVDIAEKLALWIDLRTALDDGIYGLDEGDVAGYGAALPYRLAKARGIRAASPVLARDLEDKLARTCPAISTRVEAS